MLQILTLKKIIALVLTNEQVTETGASDTRNSGIMITNYVLT